LIFLLDPNHVRANSNKISYETIIKNQTLTINKDKTYEIKNQRPDDDDDEDLEEREIYETLCRQNETEVKSNYLFFNIFNCLVPSNISIKIILSLSS